MRTPHLVVSGFLGTSWIPLVDVRGDGGTIAGIAIAGGRGYHFFRVEIDGVVLAEDYLSGILGGPAHGNNGLCLSLPFSDRLLVEVRSMVPSPQARFWASYVTSSELQTERRVTREVDGILYGFMIRSYRSDEGRTYTVEELAGPARRTEVRLDNDEVDLRETNVLSGRILLFDETGQGAAWRGAHLAVRLPGVSRPLLEQSLEISPEGQPFEIPVGQFLEPLRRYVWPVERGGPIVLEASADLEGYFNVPAAFRLV
jgi:hypothetical protein